MSADEPSSADSIDTMKEKRYFYSISRTLWSFAVFFLVGELFGLLLASFTTFLADVTRLVRFAVAASSAILTFLTFPSLIPPPEDDGSIPGQAGEPNRSMRSENRATSGRPAKQGRKKRPLTLRRVLFCVLSTVVCTALLSVMMALASVTFTPDTEDIHSVSTAAVDSTATALGDQGKDSREDGYISDKSSKTDEGTEGAGGAPTVLSFLTLVLIQPLVEEYLFRGLYYGELAQMSGIFACLMQAVMFAIAHNGVSGMMYALLAGILLGAAAGRTGSIAVPSAAHILINLRTFLYQSLIPAEGKAILNGVLLMAGIFSAVLLLFLAREDRGSHGVLKQGKEPGEEREEADFDD